ncbi:PREDICTED: uncharacterized protein LOC109157026 [Ipomoea nil]|uniref:uncharacterized protein LOC109157026 n=1 Tax=Ipomoea nil TaxID=35883 RepID=UPI000900C4C2|nr:PREDICTED: uncharacterized protein LOC109157026 [Ipomoea nil]
MEKGEKGREKAIWDCGSSLYDSFELKSFERHLHSAISSRTLSMPHLSDRRIIPPPPPHPYASKKSSSKISRSLQKLLKSVFRPRHHKSAAALSEIPEYDDRISPEIGPFVRRTASDRFKPAPVGISCA